MRLAKPILGSDLCMLTCFKTAHQAIIWNFAITACTLHTCTRQIVKPVL